MTDTTSSVGAGGASLATAANASTSPSLQAMAARADVAEITAFVGQNPHLADALYSELAKVSPATLFEVPTVLDPIVITAEPRPAVSEQLGAVGEWVDAHDGSDFIDRANAWATDKIGGLRTDIPGLSQAASVGRGVLGFVKDIGVGVVSLPGLAARSTVGLAETGAALAEGRTTPGEVAGKAWETIKAVPGAVAAPVTEAWERGDKVEAVTRGVTEVASLLIPATKIGTAGRMAETARGVDAASDLADAARSVDRLAEIGPTARTANAADPIRESWQRQDINTRWFGEDGKLSWPDGTHPGTLPDGFASPPVARTLDVGTVIDRYGGERGRFFSPEGAPFETRALPNDPAQTPYARYEVVKPLPVQSGEALPWFGEPGGATQYKTELTVRQLLDQGYLREVK